MSVNAKSPNFGLLSFRQFPRRVEFDGEAVPTGNSLTCRALRSVEEFGVFVVTAEMNE